MAALATEQAIAPIYLVDSSRELKSLMTLSRPLKWLLIVLALTTAGRGFAQSRPNCPIQPATLLAMRECYRPLLVFSPRAGDRRLKEQQSLLDQYADEMMDRFVLYVPVLADRLGFAAPLDAPFTMLTGSRDESLRRRFRVGPGEFVIILLGEDGRQKLRGHKPVSMLELDRLIDSMPGRKQELGDR